MGISLGISVYGGDANRVGQKGSGTVGSPDPTGSAGTELSRN